MEEILVGVNWLAVIVGAVASFILGWLWYSPMLFGKKWSDGHGIDLEAAGNMPMAAMSSQALGLLLMSWFVGVTAVDSKLLTFVLAVVAIGILNASGTLFAKKPGSIALIDFTYLLAAAVVMFVAQAVL